MIISSKFHYCFVTPLLGLLLRDYPSDKGLKPVGGEREKIETVKSGMDYAEAIKTPVFYALIIFAFLMIAVSTLNLFLPAYVTSLGFSVEQSASAASVIMSGVTIGKVALGYINDKNAAAGVITSVGLGIFGLIFLIMGKTQIGLITVGGFLFGWAYAGVTVETALLVRTVFGTKDYSQIFSNISIALALGGAVMAGSWGYLADLWNFKIILTVGIILLTMAGFISLYSLRQHQYET